MDGFWQDKRVLVTGADGFVASHLVEALLGRGAQVIAFVRGASLTRIAPFEAQLAGVLHGDVARPDCTELIRAAEPEVIMHLGADASVPRSIEQPAAVFAANATGTLHVLEAARRCPGLLRVVCASSSEIYGSADGDAPIDEEHALRPISPYGASKLAADRLAHAYHRTYGLPAAIVRMFSTYGPRQVRDVIPKFIQLALAGKPLTINGDGSQARDFTYVEDTVRGLLLAGSHPAAVGEAINLGSGRARSVKYVAEKILEHSGSASEIVYQPVRAAEVKLLLCANGKAQRSLGWTPEVDFDEGLRRHIAWERTAV